MAIVRIPESVTDQVREHLFSVPGEHFAFLLANSSSSRGEPLLVVDGVHLVPDEDVEANAGTWSLTTEAIVDAVNAGVRRDRALLEIHNHQFGPPEFSHSDREGFSEFVPYVMDSLPGRPYGALVWSPQGAHGEIWTQDGEHTGIDRIVSHGSSFEDLGSTDQQGLDRELFSRQLPWFGEAGQATLTDLRIGVVGAGGTGSQVIQSLSYLGCEHLTVVDPDRVETSNLNRLVTATPADIGANKARVARRYAQELNPSAEVAALPLPVQNESVLDQLRGLDVLFGCIDNDGARLVLNELSVAYHVPLFDVATGIVVEEGTVVEAGGRVVVVRPGSPCLSCTGEIDVEEAAHFLKTAEEQTRAVDRGYVSGMNVTAPAVVSLNATVASIAVNELALYIAGHRSVSFRLMYDLLGDAYETSGQRLSPWEVESSDGCVTCVQSGSGDAIRLDRYHGSESTAQVAGERSEG